MKLREIALVAVGSCLVVFLAVAGPANAEFCRGIYSSCDGLVLSTGAGLDSEMLECFLDQGISVDCQYDGNTPLIYSVVWYPNPNVVKLLLSNGANVNARNEKGETALGVAKRLRRSKLKKGNWSALDKVILILYEAGGTK